jgi:hypothetical protein
MVSYLIHLRQKVTEKKKKQIRTFFCFFFGRSVEGDKKKPFCIEKTTTSISFAVVFFF